MILWTIQSIGAYDFLMSNGYLRTLESLSDDYFLDAYEWISKIMTQKIGPPPEKVKYPIWCWYQIRGIKKRPDMRIKGYSNKGDKIVLLTVEVDEKDVLLSDFMTWHIALNNQYMADDEEEDNEKSFRSPDEIKNSWLKVFNLDYDDEYHGFMKNKSIQATMWEIKIEQIKKVEFFIAR